MSDIPNNYLCLQKARVRRSRTLERWFVSNESFTDATHIFSSGIAHRVVFDNQAPMIIFRNQNTYSDALCQWLEILTTIDDEFEIPSSVKYIANIYFTASKGLVTRKGKHLVKECDFLMLNLNGTSTCCWNERPEKIPLEDLDIPARE